MLARSLSTRRLPAQTGQASPLPPKRNGRLLRLVGYLLMQSMGGQSPARLYPEERRIGRCSLTSRSVLPPSNRPERENQAYGGSIGWCSVNTRSEDYASPLAENGLRTNSVRVFLPPSDGLPNLLDWRSSFGGLAKRAR